MLEHIWLGVFRINNLISIIRLNSCTETLDQTKRWAVPYKLRYSFIHLKWIKNEIMYAEQCRSSLLYNGKRKSHKVTLRVKINFEQNNLNNCDRCFYNPSNNTFKTCIIIETRHRLADDILYICFAIIKGILINTYYA